jgi:peptidoglycan hydrolase CwlO-like protein
MQEQAKESAKELQSILEKIEKVNDTAKDKFKELTRTDYDSSKVGPDKTE